MSAEADWLIRTGVLPRDEDVEGPKTNLITLFWASSSPIPHPQYPFLATSVVEITF